MEATLKINPDTGLPVDKTCAKMQTLEQATEQVEQRPSYVSSFKVGQTGKAIVSYKRIPEQIGPFEILGSLGRGQFTAVYKARKMHDGKIYALKFFDPTEKAIRHMTEKKMTLEDLFSKEALGDFNISLTNIAHNSVEDIGGHRFLAEEYIDRFLSDRLKEKDKMGLDEILSVAQQTAQGISHFHLKLRKVHGDIKADNLGYSKDGIVKLADFGVGTRFAAEHDGPRNNLGDPLVMAPEVYSKDYRPSPEMDVWSFGTVLYEMLTGKKPLMDRIKKTGRLKHDETLRQEIRDEIDANVKAPNVFEYFQYRQIRQLLYDCLSPNPRERPRDGKELLDRVSTLVEDRTWKGKLKKAFTASVKVSPAVLVFAIGGALVSYLSTFPVKVQPQPIVQPLDAASFTGYRDGFRTEDGSIVDPRTNKSYVVTFVKEELNNPNLKVAAGSNGSHSIYPVGHFTKDDNIAALILSYEQTVDSYYADKRMVEAPRTPYFRYLINPDQWSMRKDRGSSGMDTGPDEYRSRVVMAHILTTSTGLLTQRDGSVDLEDVCVASVVGLNKLYQAKLAAKSEDFADYITAKDKSGEQIIHPFYAGFLKTWIAQANKKVAPLPTREQYARAHK